MLLVRDMFMHKKVIPTFLTEIGQIMETFTVQTNLLVNGEADYAQADY